MSINNPIKIVGIATMLFLFNFCTSLPQMSHKDVHSIPSGYGPEDIVADNSAGYERLLISCTARRTDTEAYGEIEEYYPDQQSHRILKRKGEPEGLLFKPHGIYLARIDNIPYLYVISHNDEDHQHPVIRYMIEENQLVFNKLYSSPLLVSPNAITVFNNGSFLVCNDASKRGSRMEQILGLKKGSIVYYDGADDWTIVADKLGMPAGINHLNNTVYVSAATENKIYQYRFWDGQLSEKRVLCEAKGPDNIRFSDQDLLVACHLKTMKFVKHISDSENPSPTVIYLCESSTGSLNLVFSNDGTLISAGSVAVELQNKIYIGQIFESFIVSIIKD